MAFKNGFVRKVTFMAGLLFLLKMAEYHITHLEKLETIENLIFENFSHNFWKEQKLSAQKKNQEIYWLSTGSLQNLMK